MKNKGIVFTLALLLAATLSAQQKPISDSRQETDTAINELTPEKLHDLYLLGKVWGFIKYFHPHVGGGKFDWDLELENFFPGYFNAKTEGESKDCLLSWLNRLGDVPAHKAGDYDTLKEYKLKPDFSWISSKELGEALSGKLHFILANRQQGDQHYIKFYRIEDLNIPIFQNEKGFKQSVCPPVAIRLTALYRFWNVIEYWYPYKYNLPAAWDRVLREQLPIFLKADNLEKYTLAVERLLATIHDGHGVVNSLTANILRGYYYMPVRFKYVQNKIIVSSISNDSMAREAGLAVGDIIESIDGIKTDNIIAEKLPYISGSNLPDQLNLFAINLNRTNQPTTFLETKRGRRRGSSKSYCAVGTIIM